MCGIAGIFAYRAASPRVDHGELLRIRERMSARGPDGAGIWVSDDQSIGLAHRRLAIQDLSAAGSQPMRDEATGNWIVFNGEIYNFRQLKADLEKSGHRFRSNSDTEVLLRLYADRKEAMLKCLRGMYAFAIWDASDRSLFLARDPLGIKPLYFSNDGLTVRFASQVKALLAGGSVDLAPDAAGQVGFLIWGSVPEPFTMYRAIRAIPAGSWLRVDETGASKPIIFDSLTYRLANAASTAGVVNNALERIAGAVRKSISAHLVSDVPVGLFLSAGLDSTMLAVNAASDSPLRTVTLGFNDYSGTINDEVCLAERLAEDLRTRHSTVILGSKDFIDDREQILDAMDQPSIDGVNVWFVSKVASGLGVKVALSGVGGDELFASYPSFSQLPTMRKWIAPFCSNRSIGRALRVVSAPLVARATSPKYAGLFEYGGTLGGAYLLRRSLFMPWELPTQMAPELAQEGWEELDVERRLNKLVADIPNERLAISALEMEIYMRNQLLRDSDWASMAHSLEIRVPFADIELISDCAQVFAAVPGISKDSVADSVTTSLPEDLLSRVKTGFSTPLGDWYRADSGTNAPGLRGWARFVLDRQHKRFLA